MNKKSLFLSIKDFLKFGMVGVINTLISLIVFNILVYSGVNYLVATVIGYMVSLINGYLMSSKFVFNEEKKLETATKFVIVYLSALCINLVLMYIAVDVRGVNPSIAQFLMTFFNLIYNFTINKLWTFSKK